MGQGSAGGEGSTQRFRTPIGWLLVGALVVAIALGQMRSPVVASGGEIVDVVLLPRSPKAAAWMKRVTARMGLALVTAGWEEEDGQFKLKEADFSAWVSLSDEGTRAKDVHEYTIAVRWELWDLDAKFDVLLILEQLARQLDEVTNLDPPPY